MEGTRIVLVRHGQSVAQVEEIVGGHSGCRGLSELGRRQVEALCRRLRETGELADATAVYTSVMPRAVETGEMIAAALGRAEVVDDCTFCEQHPGDEFDGLRWSEFRQRYTIAEWSPDFRVTPDTETWREMGARVAEGLDGLVERHPGETVVVACHGGVIMHSMVRWFDLDPDPARANRAWFNPDNASITEWRYGVPPFRSEVPGWQLVRFNDHAHLAAVS